MKTLVFLFCLTLSALGFSYAEEDNLEESLAYARNEIFARHGRPFSNPVYKKYFEQFDWYQIKSNYSDSLLTESDRRDIGIIRRYEQELPNLSAEDRFYLREIVQTMKKYRYLPEGFNAEKKSDITSDGKLDSLKTSIRIIDGRVLCDSQITSDNKVLWEERLIDPFLGIGGGSSLFDPFTFDVWVRFYIASKYAVPEIHAIEDYSHISLDMRIKMGMMDLKEKGYIISSSEYKDYLVNYKGKILWHGEPEAGGNLLIWFRPLGKFITFYSP